MNNKTTESVDQNQSRRLCRVILIYTIRKIFPWSWITCSRVKTQFCLVKDQIKYKRIKKVLLEREREREREREILKKKKKRKKAKDGLFYMVIDPLEQDLFIYVAILTIIVIHIQVHN